MALAHPDEIHGDQVLALVQELKVSMLTIDTQTAPQHRRGAHAGGAAIQMHPLAVRLHVHLLQKRHQAAQGRGVWRHMVGARAQEVAVPHAPQRHQQRQVALWRGVGKVLVHGLPALQHLQKSVAANRDRQWQADGRPNRVTPTHPVPKQETVLGHKPSGIRQIRFGGDRHQLLR